MSKNQAYWNSSKFCWEIVVTEPAGDRYEQVIKHANAASQMLKDQGVKYIDAYIKVQPDVQFILITDFDWYIKNEKEIFDWAKESNINVRLNGMILEFPSNEDKMMFMLRWQ
jgi:hypothetical protein